jgi:hypothetical protein
MLSISYFQRETRTLDNGSNLADYWSFSIDSLTMETIDDDGNANTEDIATTQLLDETRYGIVRAKSFHHSSITLKFSLCVA